MDKIKRSFSRTSIFYWITTMLCNAREFFEFGEMFELVDWAMYLDIKDTPMQL